MKIKSIKILSVLAVLFVSVTSAFAADALVLSTTGTVEVGRNGEWKSCSRGSVIQEGDVISTGFKSEAIVKYNGSTMKLGSLTQVTLEQLASNEKKDSVSVYLTTGSVRSTVKHTSNKKVSYTVRNPVAVASVRGTDFDFSSDGCINCYEGAIVVYPASLFNPADFGIAHPADGKPGATPEQMKNAEDNLPADGESNPLTDKNDVLPDAPKGAVLVPAGHSTNFNDLSKNWPSSPKDRASEYHEGFSKGFNTPGDREQQNPTEGVMRDDSHSDDFGKANKKAKLNVKIEVED